MEQTGEADDTPWGRLVLRAAGGDLAAFDTFYALSAPRALAFVRTLVTEDRVEAVMTELYVAAWRQAASFRADHVGAWAWLEALARGCA